jgi:BirA family biotin operon repressor/biotin-[acetyl-CoA-carboxylase] ligase
MELKKGIFLETVKSTNLYLKEKTGETGDWVQAFQQTAGRGRGNHVWLSPRGNLYVSVIVPLRDPLTQHSLALGIAAVEFCRERGVRAHLKWPNDIEIEGKKLGGVLCEVLDKKVVAGVGLNLLQEGLMETAISFEKIRRDFFKKENLQDMGRALAEKIWLWAGKKQKLSLLQKKWLEYYHGQERSYAFNGNFCFGKIKEICLLTDSLKILSNSKQIKVKASVLLEKWPFVSKTEKTSLE